MSPTRRRRGEKNKAFRKRWFVLTTSASLVYYKSKPSSKSSKPQGATGLYAATVRRVPKSHSVVKGSAYRAALELEAEAPKGRRTFHIEAEGGADLDVWATALARAASTPPGVRVRR